MLSMCYNGVSMLLRKLSLMAIIFYTSGDFSGTVCFYFLGDGDLDGFIGDFLMANYNYSS